MAAEDVVGTAETLLKVAYPEGLGEVLMRDSPFYAEVTKEWGVGGRYAHEAIEDAPNSGVGSDFAEVSEAHDEAQRVEFQIPYHDYTAVFRFTEKLCAQAEGDDNAIVKLVDNVTKGTLHSLCKEVHWSIFGNGGAARGTIASGSGSTTIVLTNPADAQFFDRNMVVCSDDTDGSGVTPADDGEYVRILGINKMTGAITKAGGNWNANGNFAAADRLFRRGTIGRYARGLAGWVPVIAPTSTPFYGVDRSVAPEELGGIRDAATAGDGTVLAAVVRFAGLMGQFGATPDRLYLNPRTMAQLVGEMGNNARYELCNPTGKNGEPLGHIGFRYIVITVGSGPIKVFADQFCPPHLAYMLTLDTWRVRGPYEPKILQRHGNILHPTPASQGLAYEGRIAAFLHLACLQPVANGVMDLTEVLD
jgi:hypothetical protein